MGYYVHVENTFHTMAILSSHLGSISTAGGVLEPLKHASRGWMHTRYKRLQQLTESTNLQAECLETSTICHLLLLEKAHLPGRL